MSFDDIITAITRRRITFAVTLLLCVAATVVVTLALPKQYSATTTLFVGERSTTTGSLIFDTNSGEQLARTYTALASNPNVANAVRARISGSRSTDELLSQVSFAPIERTQLLQITATDSSPQKARALANIYSGTFVSQVTDLFERGAAPTRVTISQPAALPSSPSSPNVPLYLGFGGLLSLLLASGAVLLRERLDDALHLSPDDPTVLEHPVLLRLPDLARLSPQARASVRDSVGLLRTNIDFAVIGDARVQVIAVTSSGPVQGKSTVASQLATICAEDGDRTLLIEADLRRPGLARTEVGTGIEPAAAGLSTYLAGKAGVGDVLVPHPDRPSLWLIWAGPSVANPGALLSSTRLRTLLGLMRSQFDRIIIDTPPLSIGADAAVTAAESDGTLMVIDQRDTSLAQVQAGFAQLERSQSTVLGVVLNHALSRRRLESYGYYGTPTGAPGPPAGSPRGPRLRSRTRRAARAEQDAAKS